jgi:hypothetical protein
MNLDRPTTFRAAVDYLQRKGLLPTTLKTSQLEAIDAALRRYATFSAQVADARFLDEISTVIDRIVNPVQERGAYMSPPKARQILREYLQSVGYTPAEGKAGTLEDLSSNRRLDVIIRTNTEMANGFGQHVEANDPDVLDAFPCQELYRARRVDEPRQNNSGNQFAADSGYGGFYWPRLWQENGGSFYGGGRMIARKDDPIWTAISRFGHPYPPFDFNSGMWVKPVGRGEAIRLGVITASDKVQPSEAAFETPLQTGVKAFSANILAALQNALPGATIENKILTIGDTP